MCSLKAVERPDKNPEPPRIKDTTKLNPLKGC